MKTAKKPSRVYVSSSWTVKEVVSKFPVTRTLLRGWGINVEEHFNRSIRDVLYQTQGPFSSVDSDAKACKLNNIIAALYNAPPLSEEEWLLHDGPAPRDFWGNKPCKVVLDNEGIGHELTGGLPCSRYWATGRRIGITYLQKTGGVDLLSCWGWNYPRSREAFFSEGFLRFGQGETANEFKQVVVYPFGFKNRYGRNGRNQVTLVLERSEMDIHVEGEGLSWLQIDIHARIERQNRWWRVMGWLPEYGCFGLYVSDMRNAFQEITAQDASKDVMSIGSLNALEENHPDRLVSSQLYFLFVADAGSPAEVKKGVFRWSADGKLRVMMAIGQDFQDALCRLSQLRRDDSGALFARRYNHCRNVISAVPKLIAAKHPNIEALAKTAPLYLDALKLTDFILKGRPDGVYLDNHVTLSSMYGMMYAGEYKFIDRYLSFISQPGRRGPQGKIALDYDYDWTTDMIFSTWDFVDLAYLSVMGFHQFVCRNDFFYEGRYPLGKELLSHILADSDPETGLIAMRGYWPDYPLTDAGRRRPCYPSYEMGMWYEALRVWETLALEVGDLEFASRLREVAEKVRKCFVPLFYNTEHGFLADGVYPDSLKQNKVFGQYALAGLFGVFGSELVWPIAREMAERAYVELVDHEWKALRTNFRTSRFPYVLEAIWTPMWDPGLAKLFRLVGHREGLSAMRDFYEYHFGRIQSAFETFNMWPQVSKEEHDLCSEWFNYALAGWYQVIMEDFVGLAIGPGGLSLLPTGLGSSLSLKGWRWGDSRWDIDITGTGNWPISITVDGKEITGTHCLPRTNCRGGSHRAGLVFGKGKCSFPVLLEAPGLVVLDVKRNEKNKSVTWRLGGPGRGWARYLSPGKPVVTAGGQRVDPVWDGKRKEGRVEVVVSGIESVDLTVEMSDERNGFIP